MDIETFLEDAKPQPRSAEAFLDAPDAEAFLGSAPAIRFQEFVPARSSEELAARNEESRRALKALPKAEGTFIGPRPARDPLEVVRQAVREFWTPILGPTPEQVQNEGIPDAQGNPVYKPLGSKVDREGFVPALSHPMVPLPRVPQQENKFLQVGAGVVNAGEGLVEFLESPLGVATMGSGMLPRAAQRVISGGFALDMGRQLPESIDAFLGADTLQKKVETGLSAGGTALLTGLAGTHATGVKLKGPPGAKMEATPVNEFNVADVERPIVQTPSGQLPETQAPETAPVQTSTPAAHAAGAPGEVDLFGAPIVERPTVTQLADQLKHPTVELPVKDLQLSQDVPNFKGDASEETGVVQGQQLEGKYERLGTGAITVWERTDGRQEVISGRHRFDLARRTGEETIPAQVVREADGFTKEMAMTLDAEMNIRDGQGTTGDYANYFRNSAITAEEAKARGLLSRAKGKAGWALGKDAGDDLYALWRAGKITEGQAVAITQAAPGELGLQRVGSRAALKGADPLELQNFIQAVRFKTKGLPAEQLDLFGADDVAMNEAERLAKVATTLQRELDKEIRATDNAARNAEMSRKKGIKFERTPDEILKENALLRLKRSEWNNWALHPELVEQVLRDGKPALTIEQRLDSLKVDLNGKVNAFGLAPWAWNGLLDSIKRAVIAGKAMREAVREAIEWWKGKYPKEFAKADAGLEQGLHDLFEANPDWELYEDLPESGALVRLEKHETSLLPGRQLDRGNRRRQLADKGKQDIQSAAGVRTEDLLQRARSAAAEQGEFVKGLPRRADGNLDFRAMSVEQLDRLFKLEEKITNALGDYQAEFHKTGVLYPSPITFQRAVDAGTRVRARELLRMIANSTSNHPEMVSAKEQLGRLIERSQAAAQMEFAALQPSWEEHLDRLKIDTNGTVHAFGLIPEAWNKLIDLVKLGVRAGRTIAEAIDSAIEQIKALFPEHPPFDEEGLRNNLRQFGAKVMAAEELNDAVKRQVTEYRYERRENETDLQAARRIIQERGLDNAIASFKDDSDVMPGAVRSILGDELVKQMADTQRAAAAAGNRVLSEELVGKQVDVIEHDLRRSTEVAQSLQAMRRFGLMSAAGIVRHARRVFGAASEDGMQTVMPIIEELRQATEEANQTAVGATAQDVDVNEAARAAMDEAVKAAPEVHNAIVTEVAGGVAHSPEVMRQAREKIRALFASTLPTPARSRELWRRYAQGAAGNLVDAAKRAVDAVGRGGKAELDLFTQNLTRVMREQMESILGPAGSGPEQKPKTFFQRLMEGLNNPEKFMEVWSSVRDRLAEEYPKDPRIAQLLAEPMHVFSGKLMRAVMVEAMREMDFSLSEMVAGHYRAADDGRVLRDKIIERTGLDAKAATELAKVIDREFAAAVHKMRTDLDNRIGAVRAERADRLVRAVRSGTVSLDWMPAREVDRVILKTLREMNARLGDIVKRSPEAQLAAGRTVGDMVLAETGLNGPAADKLREVFDGRFRTLATEAKRRALERLGRITAVPRKVKQAYERLIEATNLGFDSKEFYDLVREKMDLPAWTPELAKEVTRRAMEIHSLPDGFQKQRAVLQLLDYVGRQREMKWHDLPMAFWYANVLSGPTTHLVNTVSNTFNLAANIGLQVLRRPAALPQILTGLGRGFHKGALEAAAVIQSGYVTGLKVQKLEQGRTLELAKLPGRWDYILTPWRMVSRALAAEDFLFFKAAEEMKSALAARSLAKGEGLRGPALWQRTREILGNLQEQVAVAERTAAKEGLQGLDYRRRVNELIEQGRPEAIHENALDYALKVTFNNQPYGVLGHIAQGINYVNSKTVITRLVVPFTNIVSNVLNESMNYFPPIGAARALWGHWKGELDGKPVRDREALYDQYAKAAAGTLGLAALAVMGSRTLQDPDPEFALYGEGPRTPAQRKQLKESGWIPNSVKLGNRYYSFANTPMALPMAILGNYLDALRWKHLDQTDALNRAAYALQQSGHIVLQQSFLDSVARLFDLVNRDATKKAGPQLAEYLAHQGQSFAVPSGLLQIDRYFDPNSYDAATVQAGLVSQVPFVRRLNKPALNVLGEPVQTLVLDRFTKAQTPDRLWLAVARQQAWIPVAPEDVVIGRKIKGEDYFRVLTPDERYEFVRMSGERIRDRLDPDRILDLDADRARAYVRRVTEEEHERAKRNFK